MKLGHMAYQIKSSDLHLKENHVFQEKEEEEGEGDGIIPTHYSIDSPHTKTLLA